MPQGLLLTSDLMARGVNMGEVSASDNEIDLRMLLHHLSKFCNQAESKTEMTICNSNN